MLQGKKVIIVGDKDGISGEAIEACLKDLDVDILLVSTECYG